MAEIKSFPNNQDEYVGAEWAMKWFHGRTSGVFGTDNNASVRAVSGTMNVAVSDGIGWISNSDGDGIVWWNDSEKNSGKKLTLTHDVADGTMARIDRIVVTWSTTNYVALPTITILKGSNSINPLPPSLTNNNIQRQISLARVYIPAGAISISDSMITDERMDKSVCGIVTESVTVDTDGIQRQVESLLEALQTELANVTGGNGYDPSPIRFENVTILPGFFSLFDAENTEERKLISAGYEYRGRVALSGVLSNMFPYVTLSVCDVDQSGVSIANQFNCYNGGVYVYANGVPESSILALSLEFRKTVSESAGLVNAEEVSF